MQTTLHIKRIAFEFDSGIRVYTNDQLSVGVRKDRDSYTLAGGSNEEQMRGVYLDFTIQGEYAEQVGASDVGQNDLEEALLKGKEMYFYPIYSIDSGIKYKVIGDSDAFTPIQSQRGLFTPRFLMQVKTTDRLTGIPTWTRTIRQR